MTPFYREVPPLDPELLATDPFFWADHAEEDLIAHEERGMRLWAQQGDYQ